MSREQVERPITGLSGKDKFKYIYVATDETEEINLALCGCGHKKKRTTREVKDSQTWGKSDSRERMKEISLDSVREAAHPTLGGQVTRPVTFLVVSMARGYHWDIPWSGGTEKHKKLQAEVHSSSFRQIKTVCVWSCECCGGSSLTKPPRPLCCPSCSRSCCRAERRTPPLRSPSTDWSLGSPERKHPPSHTLWGTMEKSYRLK